MENIKPGVSIIKRSSGVLVLTQPKRSFGPLSLFLNSFKLKLLISQDTHVSCDILMVCADPEQH